MRLIGDGLDLERVGRNSERLNLNSKRSDNADFNSERSEPLDVALSTARVPDGGPLANSRFLCLTLGSKPHLSTRVFRPHFTFTGEGSYPLPGHQAHQAHQAAHPHRSCRAPCSVCISPIQNHAVGQERTDEVIPWRAHVRRRCIPCRRWATDLRRAGGAGHVGGARAPKRHC